MSPFGVAKSPVIIDKVEWQKNAPAGQELILCEEIFSANAHEFNGHLSLKRQKP